MAKKKAHVQPSLEQVLGDASRAAQWLERGAAVIEQVKRLVATPQSQVLPPEILSLRDALESASPGSGRVAWRLLWNAMTRPKSFSWWQGLNTLNEWQWRRIAVFDSRIEVFDGEDLHRFPDVASATKHTQALGCAPKEFLLGRGWTRKNLKTPGVEWLERVPRCIVDHVGS